jgi:agmatinase
MKPTSFGLPFDAANLEPEAVAVLGLPWDQSSSYLMGPALAPARIRQALDSPVTSLTTESGLDLRSEPRFQVLGDLDLQAPAEVLLRIEEAIDALLEQGAHPVSLGGDHSVALPILRGFARHFDDLTVLQLDAHPDLYDELDGDRLSHACPFARVMEEGLVSRLVQVGIRTVNPHQLQQAERFGVEMLQMRQVNLDNGLPLELGGPVYLSLDLDALDPAFAPGVSHPEPGGLSTRSVIRLLQNLKQPFVGADIVELNPNLDLLGLTAKVAAKLVKEIAAQMLGTAPA